MTVYDRREPSKRYNDAYTRGCKSADKLKQEQAKVKQMFRK